MDEKLITACRKSHRDAQRQVYEIMAPKLYHTCKRYLKSEEMIEEAMADAFFTIFTKLDQLKETKAFEAWARKIAVNQCLLSLKKNVNFNIYIEDMARSAEPSIAHSAALEEEDLLHLLTYLPEGCRTVFNLFAIEGYSHKEIAVMLNISEGTSKSQLNASRTKLKEMVNNVYYQNEKSHGKSR
ncbi:sigma-70 family RNA polymerase sigma factor [Flavobacterium sp. DGU11]|uniref:Sigma-70 family RNA polymerase sigma factor n=2 Tax=Flavobacterium arundinis TaxID=3139143 RepID=A0ABU9I1L2_9FLAO